MKNSRGPQNVTVRIMGGLGNQMFQYAAGLALSRRLGLPLKLDLSFYQFAPKFTYSLGCFGKEFESRHEIVSFSEVRARSGLILKHVSSLALYYRLYNKFFYTYPKLLPISCAGNSIFCEKSFHFDKAFLNIASAKLLVGYFQSQLYFEKISSEIRTTFKLPTLFGNDNLKVYQSIKSGPSVSVHIRRGDYVSDKATNETHGTCDLTYYYDAVRVIGEKRGPLNLYIFSDDPDWARENWQLNDYPAHFVTGNQSGSFDGNKDSLDMSLMSACRDQVIANSSFSWWAAWLNSRVDKIVIAPKRWFKDPRLNDSTVIPREWRRM